MKWINKLKSKLAQIVMKKKVDPEHTIGRESDEVLNVLPSLPSKSVMKDQAIDLPVPLEINRQEKFVEEPTLENRVIVEKKEIQTLNFENVLIPTAVLEQDYKKLMYKLIVNKAKKNADSTDLLNIESKLKIEQPLTPLPKYNEDGDYDNYKNHYLYYLANGTNYERKVVIQKVKKAVMENKERQIEWIKPLLDLSGYPDNIIRQYAFLALLSFTWDDISKDLILKNFENDSFDMIKKRVEKERQPFIKTVGSFRTEQIVTKEDQTIETKLEQKPINMEGKKKVTVKSSLPKENLDRLIIDVERVKEMSAVAETPIVQNHIHVKENKERNKPHSQRKVRVSLKLNSYIQPTNAENNRNPLNIAAITQLEVHESLVLGNERTPVTGELISKADFVSPQSLMANALEIQQVCKERNIKSIYHFTNARNVSNIMTSGILSVDQLKKQSMKYEYNDENRLDNMLHASCWSISFTNTKYFHNARVRETDMKWCVIECDASPLWELPCYFFETNAASNKMKKVHFSQRMGVNALEKMFERNDSEILPVHYPTDVQAEVLIVQPVLPTKIKSIYTNNQLVFDYYNKRYPGMFKLNDKLFKYRN